MSTDGKVVPLEIDRDKHASVLAVWNSSMENCETLEMTWPKLVRAISMDSQVDSWERVCVALGEHVDTDIERIIKGIEHLRAQCRSPAPAAGVEGELVERLTDCLNHAVSELARAAYSEEFDSADCTDCIERINDLLTPMGKTPDWHMMSKWYDRLCAAAGVDNGDEIDILPLVEQKLRDAAAIERQGAKGGEALTFDAFRVANKMRCLKWHPLGIESWSPSDWLTAVTGELGELASLLKMRNRERDSLPGNKFSPTDKQVADEIADVLTYLDLLACALGVDLGSAAISKFNEVSERVGFPDRIPAAPPLAQPEDSRHE